MPIDETNKILPDSSHFILIITAKTIESVYLLLLRALVKASQQRSRAILGRATSWPICLIFAHT